MATIIHQPLDMSFMIFDIWIEKPTAGGDYIRKRKSLWGLTL